MMLTEGCWDIGSSPHKWGIHLHIAKLHAQLRFIPTQVGNTSSATKVLPQPLVHPHTSGEYGLTLWIRSARVGSSPHKWGIPMKHILSTLWQRFIPTQVGNTAHLAGFIPTQVGNTAALGLRRRMSSVHPHTSGEYGGTGIKINTSIGSSPHKWGIQPHNPHGGVVGRFIPTQVGNTTQPQYQPAAVPVHPHTSGEYTRHVPRTMASCGSSPHKWGILHQGNLPYWKGRFIPTQVGNTVQELRLLSLHSVHPHTSGEYHTCSGESSSGFGSSPHKWGILLPRRADFPLRRFIPTQVGNTPCSPLPHRCSPVHPHTSGEYTVYIGKMLPGLGSSPHKWGIQYIGDQAGFEQRFIPTQVGNT